MTDNIPSKPGRFAPRYWPTWIYIGIIYFISCLPWRLQLIFGKVLGRVLRADKRLNQIARTNISRCLPELSESEADDLLRKYFSCQGIDLVESLNIWASNGFKLAEQHLEVEGLEHIEAALRQDRGVILIGSHFSNVDMGAVLMAYIGQKYNLFDFSVTYRPQKDPVFDGLMKRGRLRYFKQVIPSSELRPIVQELKNKHWVWFAPDMDIDRKNAVFVPFMGIEAATTTAISRLAKMTNAMVIPYRNTRTENRFEYRVKISPPLTGFPSDDIVADTTRINQFIEEQVRSKPEAYLWILRRFKTRPPGESSFY
ncbi:MAG: lipid A biosynthesis acyltransferase [Pseudomonadota bacterium]